MDVSILATKLYIPPPRPNRVPRSRLLERLDEGLHLGYKLTLLSAPAGFGKTTLLSEWIANCGRSVAWVSLDEGDNDQVQFLTYLVGALQTVDKAIGQSAKGLLQSLQLSPAASAPPGQIGWMRAPTTALINDVASAAAPLILALDDYHLISSAPVHGVMQFLLEHQPPSMHVVISTREDPSLPLARLRALGQIAEIRERDLRFTMEEASGFLNRTMGLHLSSETVDALQARTEGWIAGLQLAALGLQESTDTDAFVAAFTGSDRHVTDYLVEEVLHRQPEEIQSFLLHTAILDRLSAPLCQALLSDISSTTSSQAILEHLDTANLFIIPLDNQREWYRYHQLFADLLRYQLQREYPERLADLHRRAAQWYEQADIPDEAFRHALAMPDYKLAAHVAEQYGMQMCGDARLATYLNWVRQIPDDVIFTRPYLCVACGWAHLLTGQAETAERYVQAGEATSLDFERLYVAPEGRFVTRQEVRGHLVAIRAYGARMRGDFANALEYSRQALAQLPDDVLSVRCVVALNLGIMYHEQGALDAAQAAVTEAFEMALQSGENIYVATSALGLLGNILIYRGKLWEAEEVSQRAVELGMGEDGKPLPSASSGYWGLGMVYYERHELATAARHLETALTLLHQIGQHEGIMDNSLYRAQLALMAGDLARAEDLLDQIDKLAQTHQIAQYSLVWMATRGELCLKRGDIDSALRCAQAIGLQAPERVAESLATETYEGRMPDVLLLVRILLAQGRFDEALDLAERLAATAEARQYGAVLIEATILQALAHHLQEDDDRALECLERALALGAPEGFVRPFVAAGQPMATLLQQAASRGYSPEYVNKLLTAFNVPEYAVHSSPSTLVEPLSERELEVLRWIAAGLSNPQIAEQLYISINTVRFHTKNIYGKLGVNSRTQAVSRARELALL
jgi:LuxR family maltose regulon positive regulatory protein